MLISVTTDSVSKPFNALVDSGSTHCFVDTDFVTIHKLKTRAVPPIALRLFDGSSNSIITLACDLPLYFPCGTLQTVTAYVTTLDSSCSIVLGHDWLAKYNPSINWTSSQIKFRTFAANSNPTPARAETPLLANSTTTEPPDSISIALVDAQTFLRASELDGSQVFQLSISSSVSARSSALSNIKIDLTGVPEKYHDFADVFSKSKGDALPPHRDVDLKIDLLEGTEPPIPRVYPLSQPELTVLRDFLEEHLRLGFIRPTSSPHGAPVLFIKKKDGTLRLCVDFRMLNQITKKDRYPLPMLTDLLNAPRKASVYTKIDLRHAYHLIRIREGDEWKTAFRTRYGSFEWLVMPFGLTNGPAAFQRHMNTIFADLLDVCVIVYLDDILVYSESPDTHTEQVREVLRRLRKHGLFAKGEKCSFDVDKIEYLGYIMGPDGLSMDQSKVQTITDWPVPRKVKDIQSFLGFANFYRRFIHNYSAITVPLTRLTRKGTPWNFDDECLHSFETLKAAFTSAPILAHWQPDRPIIVETDASDYALGAILSIVTADEEIHPVAFLSRTFTSTERNYDVHDKELLAIFEAFKSWRQFLEGSGTPIDVVTDHKNLEYFSTTKILTRRQARWSEYLSQFNIVIRFRPGRLGGKPDSLTRRWDVYAKEGSSDYAVVNPQNYKPIFTTTQLVASHRATYLTSPVLRGVSTMDVVKLHRDILAELPNDPVTQKHLDDDFADSRWSRDDQGFVRLDGKIYVPDRGDLRLSVLKHTHDHPLSGHYGFNKTLALIRRDYTWPAIREFVKEYCKACTVCMRNKPQRHKPYGLLKQLPVPEKPWNSISMDFIEQLPPSSTFTSILVVVDRFSKQAIFIPTFDTITSHDLARLFVIHVFSKHGAPAHVTSDRGSEFVSHFFRSLGQALDMKLHFTSGHHPEGDGQTERVNQTLEQYLRMYCNYQQDNWADLLPLAEFAYNNAPNAATGVSPFFANKGYHPNLTVHPERDLASARAQQFVTDLDELHQNLRKSILDSQEYTQKYADRSRLPAPPFKVGDQVYVKAEHFRTTRPTKKLAERYLGPYEIIAQAGTRSFTLRLPPTFKMVHPVFHVSMLEPATPNTIPNRIQPPPPPVVIDGETQYEIDAILDSKIDKRRRFCPLLYLVKWSGYEGTDQETEWMPATELGNASELVGDFHSANPTKPGPLHQL